MGKVLIYGAGSIGNHLARAARETGYEVVVTDKDEAALRRMREEIYPLRYGKWDEAITLAADLSAYAEGEFSVVCIGTPPAAHWPLLQEASRRWKPRLLHVEKAPFIPADDLAEIRRFVASLAADGTMVTVGYNHAVAPSFSHMCNLVKKGVIGEVLLIEGYALEHWGGILSAHPWLSSHRDSYLGFSLRGGGALSEHSHALHLVYTVAEMVWGKGFLGPEGVVSVSWCKEHYDARTELLWQHAHGYARVAQDVITTPPIKGVRVQGAEGRIELSLSPSSDKVVVLFTWGAEEHEFPKERSDDFLALFRHYEELLAVPERYVTSPLHMWHGIAVQEIINAVVRQQGWR